MVREIPDDFYGVLPVRKFNTYLSSTKMHWSPSAAHVLSGHSPPAVLESACAKAQVTAQSDIRMVVNMVANGVCM